MILGEGCIVSNNQCIQLITLKVYKSKLLDRSALHGLFRDCKWYDLARARRGMDGNDIATCWKGLTCVRRAVGCRWRGMAFVWLFIRDRVYWWRQGLSFYLSFIFTLVGVKILVGCYNLQNHLLENCLHDEVSCYLGNLIPSYKTSRVASHLPK